MCLSISMPFDLSSPTGTFYVMSHIHCVLPTQYLKLSWLTLTKRLRQPIWIGCEIYEEPQFSENWLQNLCKCIRLAVGVQESVLFGRYLFCTRFRGLPHSSQNLRRASLSIPIQLQLYLCGDFNTQTACLYLLKGSCQISLILCSDSWKLV